MGTTKIGTEFSESVKNFEQTKLSVAGRVLAGTVAAGAVVVGVLTLLGKFPVAFPPAASYAAIGSGVALGAAAGVMKQVDTLKAKPVKVTTEAVPPTGVQTSVSR